MQGEKLSERFKSFEFRIIVYLFADRAKRGLCTPSHPDMAENSNQTIGPTKPEYRAVPESTTCRFDAVSPVLNLKKAKTCASPPAIKPVTNIAAAW